MDKEQTLIREADDLRHMLNEGRKDDAWIHLGRVLLGLMGEDPGREGLLDTPRRIRDAWRQRLVGYSKDPEEILAKNFGETDGYDQIVLLRNISFDAICEHHLMRFAGKAHVAYIPSKENPRVLGISKMARLVDCFSNRLTIQERITKQVADAITEHVQPQGVAVVLVAEHGCIACRGAMKPGAECVTSAMEGVFRTKHEARDEVMRMMGVV